MKRTTLIFIAFAMLASCKKTNTPSPEEILSPDIDLVVRGATQESFSAYPPSDTYNFLGFGYDVSAVFDDEASVRATVVDIPALATSGQPRVNLNRGTEASWQFLLGEDAPNLAKRLSGYFQTTNGTYVFGNTLAKFPETRYEDKKYVYGYYSYYMKRKSWRFYPDQIAKSFLSNGFREDVATLNPEELVRKYGTHVLIGIKIGAKFDIVYQSVAPLVDHRRAIAMEGFRYALKSTFGLTSGYLDDVDLKNLNANSSAQIYYRAVGGDISRLTTQLDNNKKVFVDIRQWATSTTEDKAKFLGPLHDDIGLEPLYNFISDVVKKEAVKSYVEQYLAARSVKAN